MNPEKIINFVENINDAINFRGFKICTVISTNPFIFEYKGVQIGAKFNDEVYVHPLFVSNLISQEIEALSEIQNFKSSTAYNSPTFQALIEGSLPNFVKDFYLFYKNWQSIFILNPGDLISVLEIENGGYLVLQKVEKNIFQETEENN